MSWETVMNAAEAAKSVMLSDRPTGEKQFELLIRQTPGDGMVYYHRGLAFESLGENKLAEEDLQKAFSLFPQTKWKNGAKEALERVRQQTHGISSGSSAKQAAAKMLVFISHSSKDFEIVLALIEFLRASLGLRDEQIRCTSVDGFKLSAGIHTDEQLRLEVRDARAFIGLITPQSRSSTYVLFELGARWGANLPLFLLLAGVESGSLEGPLKAINALSCNNVAQLHQLVDDLAKVLYLPPQRAAAYTRYLDNFIAKLQTRHESASARRNISEERKVLAALDGLATNRQILAMLRPFRELRDRDYVTEAASRAFGGSLKFWRKNPKGKAEVAFALNLSGNLGKTPHGQLDIWMLPSRFARILGISEARTRKLFNELPVLESRSNKCIVRLRTQHDAESVARRLQAWFENYADSNR